MPFLGQALADHLLALQGLYSVQLPEALRPELAELVSRINSATPRRAVYVTDSDIPGVLTSRWAEVLKWRTADDRVFAWERGAGEPDTSFQSAVREFVGSRFPIASGLCDLDALAEICVRFLFASRGVTASGVFFDAFMATARWIAEVYALAFQELGTLASLHWTDRFLAEWAAFCDDLPRVLDRAAGGGYHPRFAWELLRVAGLIVPSLSSAGNPFVTDPRELLPSNDRQRLDYVRTWQEAVRDFIVSPGQLPVLLNELDRRVQGAGERTPWRDLDWNAAQAFEVDAPATGIGRAVFLGESSLSVIGPAPPTFPVAPAGAWWGVTAGDLESALEATQLARPVQPQPTTVGLVQLLDSTDAYLLATRSGNVSYSSTPRRWRCAVQCGDINLEYRERWKNLFVSRAEPAGATEGDAWIDPDGIGMKVNGKGVTVTVVNAESVSNILYLNCTLRIEFAASIDPDAQTVTGVWEAYRVLTLSLKVRDRLACGFMPAREVKSQMDLIVPSPFAPTIVVVGGGVIVSPSAGDEFARGLTGNRWQPLNTPEIQLDEQRSYAVSVYEGTVEVGTGNFSDPVSILIGGEIVGPDATTIGLFAKPCRLEDGTVILRRGGSLDEDLAVVRILEEKAAAVSSGILAVLQGRTVGRRPPSAQATTSLLGRYQTAVVRAVSSQLGTTSLESLFQIVIPSDTPIEAWPEQHPGGRSPLFLGDFGPTPLPGIGNGPARIFGTPEWNTFAQRLKQVCAAIGLAPGAQELWLSAFDPTGISSSLVRDYNEAHAALIAAAKKISAVEAFWASYPFSVFIVDGEAGRNFGRLRAVLLSPLHPVRLSWLHGVGLFAQELQAASLAARELLGLVEGWNFPLVGYAPSPTERTITLVAVPLDPGHERDFLGWSALAVLTNSVVDIPATAVGLPLPWAGRSGINDKVVSGALTDYLNVSPYVASIVVDLRSVARAPRSAEIDKAVLEFLTDVSDPVIAALSGGARVWDSSYREGDAPARDELLALRGDAPEADAPFEWRTYPAQDVPAHADVAFIENASVSLDVVDGATTGFIGPLSIRRLLPADDAPGRMDQNFSPAADEDILGLARLLRQIESPGSENAVQALRASPSLQTLGIAKGGKWEVIGTFNLSPSLLALTINGSGQSNRLLWEWRPSWLNPEKQGYADPSRRPYFVIARIPASLSTGLAMRQALTPDQIAQVIAELGSRAVGLATLYAAGDTHESAAAGFFYALQLLVPSNVQLPAGWQSPPPSLQSLIALDPISELLEAVADKKFQRRADLLALRCTRDSNGTHLCLTPIEVKHHGTPANPQQRPDARHPELKRAREQLKQTQDMLVTIRDSFPTVDGSAMLALGRRLAVGVLVDFALDFATRPVPATERAAILADIMNGRCSISVGTPCLLWFAPGSIALNGAALIRDQHVAGDFRTEEAYIDPYPVRGLWWGGCTPGPDDRLVRQRVDDMIADALAGCVAASTSAADLRPPLRSLLRLGEQTVQAAAAVPETGAPSGRAVTAEVAASTESALVEAPMPPPEVPPVTAPQTVPVVTAVRPPELLVGARAPGSRWMMLGKLANRSPELVALDLDQPKAIGIFGYMGSGKSYLVGAITEAAVQQIPNLNQLGSPLAVVVFNYRRNASDRFELFSLALVNPDENDVQRLASEFGARPDRVADIQILALRGELNAQRLTEYASIPAQELLFRPASLTVEDWELLMGQPGAERVYAQAIRHALIELRDEGDVSVGSLRHRIQHFAGTSRAAAEQRLSFAARHLSEARGINFEDAVRPGRILIIDLRQPLFNKDDALRFFLVCATQISRIQGQFNKLVIFDEAHEYLSDAFGERLESRIRQIRHEGTSYIFATQDVGSIPTEIQRFISAKFVFGLGSRQNVDDLLEFAPEFRGFDPIEVTPGMCFVQSNISSRNFFAQPRLVKVRPRITAHGGSTRIFT